MVPMTPWDVCAEDQHPASAAGSSLHVHRSDYGAAAWTLQILGLIYRLEPSYPDAGTFVPLSDEETAEASVPQAQPSIR